MGELLGLPEWAFATLFVLVFTACIWTLAWRNTSRQIRQTLAMRPNLSLAEFITQMSSDVAPDTAAFIYDETSEPFSFFKAKLTCHPDDDFVTELPIDEEEWFEDWPTAWAQQQGIAGDSLPDWPTDWPTTVRNYGRWLDRSSH